MRQPATAEQADDDYVPRDDLGAQIEHAIERIMRTAALSPAARVCLEGNLMHVEAVELPPEGPDYEPERVFRNVSTSPLEALYHSKRSPLELYQYLAGCRWRMDWYLAQLSPLSAVDYTRSAMFVTELMKKHASGGYIAGIDGPAMAQALRQVRPTPDHKLDAMKRVGDALGGMPRSEGWILQRWVGEEFTLAQIAAQMGEDARVAHYLARNSLTLLAEHYRMCSAARTRRRG